MRLIFLGTSGSIPTSHRGLTAIAIQRGGELMLFDCGEGTQRQMIRAELSLMKIGAIYITHLHGDHFLGLAGLVQTMSLMDRDRELEIYGPPGAEERIGNLIQLPIYTLKFDVKIQNLNPGETIRRKDYRIETRKIKHGTHGIAYALIEDERPGKFYPEKASRLGVNPGPDFSRLQRGRSVELPDGRIVKPDQVMGPPRPGRKVVYANDSRPSQRILELSKDADVLIHDGMFGGDLIEVAKEAGHSTVEEAAEVAKKADVKRLILTHISPRYSDSSEIEREAQKIFPNTVVADDLMDIEVELKK